MDPGEYNHPDHFDIYANAVLYHAASHLVYKQPLTKTFDDHKLLFYRISRIFVALLGTACIVAAYLIGKEFNANTGLIAALLVAIFPSYVDHSHYITADMPLALFILSVILFAVRYLKHPSHRNLLAGALFCALSLSVKYPGGLTLLLMVSVIISKHFRERTVLLKRLSETVSAFLLFLFLASPYLFLNYDKAIKAVLVNAYPIHLGADGLGWPGNMAFYATSYLDFSGVIMLLFFFLGGVYIVRKEKPYALPVFFGLFYWMVLSKVGLHWERWALPMYTCPLLVSAYGINVAHEKAVQLSRRYLFPFWCVALFLIVCKLLIASSVMTAQFTLKDTRFASYLFTQKAGIAEENTLYEGFTPFYPSNMRDGSVLNAYNTLDKNKTIRYVIVSSGLYDRYLGEIGKYHAEAEFYGKVFSLPLVRKFAPREYFSDGSYPFYLNNDLARGLAFLLDYTRDREQLFTGPTIGIYRYVPPGFLDR
ncbi:glycosyltransferase family 39 protein [Geobacter sp. AOG2]|uniref:ArnT family glycosyltransferase n=1 Tax=Geobacter sp. AOG2 TaxID=1566347 RepID=UPI001CC57011|nr:glycosyltransferase family 39 protein [Geobacter sp. AOG2]